MASYTQALVASAFPKQSLRAGGVMERSHFKTKIYHAHGSINYKIKHQMVRTLSTTIH